MHRPLKTYDDALRLAGSLGDTWSTSSELVSLVASRRGRAIIVVPADLTGTGITGTALIGEFTDSIVHATGLPPFFTDHIIFHEVSHLLLGHLDGAPTGNRPTSPCASLDPASEDEAELLATAFAQVQQARARTGSVHMPDGAAMLTTLAPHLTVR